MAIVLSLGDPVEFGVRAVCASGDGLLLRVGHCGPAPLPEQLPDGPWWLAGMWPIAARPGEARADVPGGVQFLRPRRSADEVLVTLQARVSERGPWWLVECDGGAGGLQWSASGPRGAGWQIAWQPIRYPQQNVRAWREASGRTRHLGHATTKPEARAEAVRIAALIAAGTQSEG